MGWGSRGRLLRKFDDLKSPRAMGEAAQEPAFFKRRDQPVNARLGGQIECILHLIKGRRHAGFLDALMDEHQQFVLFTGQHGQVEPSSVWLEQSANLSNVL